MAKKTPDAPAAGTIRDTTPEERAALAGGPAMPAGPGVADAPADPAELEATPSLAGAPAELRTLVETLARCATWDHARAFLLRTLAR